MGHKQSLIGISEVVLLVIKNGADGSKHLPDAQRQETVCTYVLTAEHMKEKANRQTAVERTVH